MRLTIAVLLFATSFHLAGQTFKEQKSATVTYNYESDSEKTFSRKIDNSVPDSLVEFKDSRIDLLIQDFVDHKKNFGYRIQLFSGNSRWEAQKVKTDFLAKYTDQKSPYLIYQQPNFKIRVGNYRDRLEANKFLEIYKVNFPSAFIVKDEIELVLKK